MGSLEELGIEYIERVVNRRDITAVDEMVAAEYRGSGRGWPRTIDELRQFYSAQMRDRPDWRIDVQEVVELGDSLVIRAHAYGTVRQGGKAHTAALDWLAHYRFLNRRITEINLLTVVPTTRD